MDPTFDLVWSAASAVGALSGLVAWLFAHGEQSEFVFLSNLSMISVPFVLLASRMYMKHDHPMVVETTSAAVMIGGASFAFHQDGVLGTPQHTLDIFLAWVLYVQLATAACFAIRGQGLLTAMFARSVALMLLFVAYEHVYHHQVAFFVTMGAVAYAATFVTQCSRRTGVARTDVILDSAALLSVQACAVAVQGGIWFDIGDSYDVGHGYWHIFNAVLVGVYTLHMVQVMCSESLYVSSTEERVARVATTLFALSVAAVILTDDDHPPLMIVLGMHGVWVCVSVVCIIRLLHKSMKTDTFPRSAIHA